MSDKLKPFTCNTCDNCGWCKIKDGYANIKQLFPDIQCHMYTPEKKTATKIIIEQESRQ